MLFFNDLAPWSSRYCDTSKYCLTVVPVMVINEGKMKIMRVCPPGETLERSERSGTVTCSVYEVRTVNAVSHEKIGS
jgi:hypothetical protein